MTDKLGFAFQIFMQGVSNEFDFEKEVSKVDCNSFEISITYWNPPEFPETWKWMFL